MAHLNSLSICARITLDMHNLNSEGTEGNQQQTRMVHIIDQTGRRAIVNAVSGDMFKHILVEHLVPLLQDAEQFLSPGAKVYSADRINELNKPFEEFCAGKVTESEIMTRMLTECSLTDMAGALVTRGRSVGRKSVAEFGWVVGLPSKADGEPLTATEQYFHVKYAPEGRGVSTGSDTVSGKQAIFHRPASSGVYALICNLDLYRIGLNDITRQYVVDAASRQRRATALIHALAATLLKPSGAQRNTQNPHIVNCEGAIATSATSLPAPTVSPLHDEYRNQMGRAADVLNGIKPDGVRVMQFESLADGVRVLADLASGVELPN
ncbi:MAG: DevR family CRISPR-associated autoregulator [Candidatus Binataceae bacterium]